MTVQPRSFVEDVDSDAVAGKRIRDISARGKGDDLDFESVATTVPRERGHDVLRPARSQRFDNVEDLCRHGDASDMENFSVPGEPHFGDHLPSLAGGRARNLADVMHAKGQLTTAS